MNPRRIASLLVKSSALLTACLIASCAAARDPTTGEIVVGFGLARLPETGNQLIASAAKAATGLPWVGDAALGLLAATGIGYGAVKRAEKKGEDRGYVEAQTTYSPPPGTVLVQALPATIPPTPPAPAVPAPAGATQ